MQNQLACALWVIFILPSLSAAAPLELQKTAYTEKIEQLSMTKAPHLAFKLKDGEQNSLLCLATPGKPFLVGLAHAIKINAPIEKVLETFEDFPQYAELFSGLKKVEVTSRSESGKTSETVTLKFESEIPVPFVPNKIYSILYTKKKSLPDEVIYKFQIYKHEDFNGLDGLVIIKKITPLETYYYEIDFLDAKWGILEKISPKMIWKQSVTDFIQGDFALKFRAENFSKPLKKVKREAELETTDRNMEKRILDCIKEKLPAPTF